MGVFVGENPRNTNAELCSLYRLAMYDVALYALKRMISRQCSKMDAINASMMTLRRICLCLCLWFAAWVYRIDGEEASLSASQDRP